MLKSYIAQELKKAEAKVGRNRAVYCIYIRLTWKDQGRNEYKSADHLIYRRNFKLV